MTTAAPLEAARRRPTKAESACQIEWVEFSGRASYQFVIERAEMNRLFMTLVLSWPASVGFSVGQINVLTIDGVNNHDRASIARAARSTRRQRSRDNASRRSRSRFTKQVDVFGLRIYATNTTGNNKLLHAANVLAEYIDNDEDGVPDNPRIMKALIEGKGAIVMKKTEEERPTGPRPRGQGLYDEETIPNGRAQGRFDASLEEILHMVSDVGWAGAYPDVFARVPGTAISNAMDKARGGRFRGVPDRYPDGAWYTYDDETCDYDCQNSEYIYWALTSILGAQDYPGRLEQIDNEWRLNSRLKVKEGDPAVYAILTRPEYKLPTVLPDGKYKAKKFTIQKYP